MIFFLLFTLKYEWVRLRHDVVSRSVGNGRENDHEIVEVVCQHQFTLLGLWVEIALKFEG